MPSAAIASPGTSVGACLLSGNHELDELSELVVKRREEGAAWKAIADEAHQKGLIPTANPKKIQRVHKKALEKLKLPVSGQKVPTPALDEVADQLEAKSTKKVVKDKSDDLVKSLDDDIAKANATIEDLQEQWAILDNMGELSNAQLNQLQGIADDIDLWENTLEALENEKKKLVGVADDVADAKAAQLAQVKADTAQDIADQIEDQIIDLEKKIAAKQDEIIKILAKNDDGFYDGQLKNMNDLVDLWQSELTKLEALQDTALKEASQALDAALDAADKVDTGAILEKEHLAKKLQYTDDEIEGVLKQKQSLLDAKFDAIDKGNDVSSLESALDQAELKLQELFKKKGDLQKELADLGGEVPTPKVKPAFDEPPKPPAQVLDDLGEAQQSKVINSGKVAEAEPPEGKWTLEKLVEIRAAEKVPYTKIAEEAKQLGLVEKANPKKIARIHKKLEKAKEAAKAAEKAGEAGAKQSITKPSSGPAKPKKVGANSGVSYDAPGTLNNPKYSIPDQVIYKANTGKNVATIAEELDIPEAKVNKILKDYKAKLKVQQPAKYKNPYSIDPDGAIPLEGADQATLDRIFGSREGFDFQDPRWWTRNFSPKDLPDHAQESVRLYTGHSYGSINGSLRSGRRHTAMTGIDEAMRPIPRKVTVNRGVSDGKCFGLDDINDIGKLKPGTIVEDQAYLSTAVTQNGGFTANKPVKLVMELPENTPAVWAKPISQHAGEEELLLAREIKWAIVSVDKVKQTRGGYAWVVRMRAILD